MRPHDVWRHSAVTSTSSVAASLDATMMAERRKGFEADLLAQKNKPGLEQKIFDSLLAWRQTLAADVWYEEILELGPEAKALIPQQDIDKARAYFGKVCDHLLFGLKSGSAANDLRARYRRLCVRVSPHVWEDPVVGAKLHRLACQLYADDSANTRPQWYDPAMIPLGDGVTIEQRLELRQVDKAMHLMPLASAFPRPGSPLANLRTVNGQITITDAPPHAPDDWRNFITKPAWASDWGYDKFGMWAEIAVGDVRQRLRRIPSGQFLMGSPEDEHGRWDDEGPQHEVTLTQGYWLFDTPCTQALWLAVMGENPGRFQAPDRPVENVSWDDVQTFLSRLNKRLPGLDLDLPSEAQWEYACRAGTGTARYGGDSDPSDDILGISDVLNIREITNIHGVPQPLSRRPSHPRHRPLLRPGRGQQRLVALRQFRAGGRADADEQTRRPQDRLP